MKAEAPRGNLGFAIVCKDQGTLCESALNLFSTSHAPTIEISSGLVDKAQAAQENLEHTPQELAVMYPNQRDEYGDLTSAKIYAD